ncbi:hypothetical protein PF004_g23569, partial [Phytophthora fragariae]
KWAAVWRRLRASGSQFDAVYGQVGRSLASSTAKWAAVWRRLRPSGSQFGVVYGQVGRSLVSSTAKWAAAAGRIRGESASELAAEFVGRVSCCT